MLVDTTDLNYDEMELIKKIEDRLKEKEDKISDLLKKYNIPADIENYEDKLNFALAKIGDDEKEKIELKEKFKNAEDELGNVKDNVAKDFVNLAKIGNEKIEKITKRIYEVEIEYNKQLEEKAIKEEKIKVIDIEIEEYEKNIVITRETVEMNKKLNTKIKEESRELIKKIEKIDKKIAEIDKKIELLLEANDKAQSEEELKENTLEIESLKIQKSELGNIKADISKLHEQKVDEKNENEKKINKDEEKIKDLYLKINDRSVDKNLLENEIRLLPEKGKELENIKETFRKQKDDFYKTIEDTEKLLEGKGIEIKTDIEKTDGEKLEKEDKLDKNIPQKNGVNNGQNIEQQPTNYPKLTDEDIKEFDINHIIGKDSSGNYLKSEDRIQNNIENYDDMVSALERLKNSPAKLTKQEKKQILQVMKDDKQTIAKNVKDIDVDKLGKLLKSAGVKIDEKELESLHYASYEDQSKMGQLNNLYRDYGKAKYGILDGFTQMKKPTQDKWGEVVSIYNDNKEKMSKQDREEFEKYIVAPIKFGTIHAKAKDVCSNPIIRFFSKGKNDRIANIAKSILESKNVSKEEKKRNFADGLRESVEKKYPPIKDKTVKEIEEDRQI